MPRAPAHDAVEHLLLEEPHAGNPGGAERAALHERLERALVDHLRVDPLAEVPDRKEGAVPPGGEDSSDGALPYVLYRVQSEADFFLDDAEVLCGDIHIGR